MRSCDEVFSDLAHGTSHRQWNLTGVYTLGWCAGTFFVVDYDNARQLRSADTLSGGETFRLARGLYSMFYVLKAVE
jgi:DNA repair exonuclease SbcCD ATPase subunit